jgi:hypothetical protein
MKAACQGEDTLSIDPLEAEATLEMIDGPEIVETSFPLHPPTVDS